MSALTPSGLILFVLAAETDDFDHLSIDHTEVKFCSQNIESLVWLYILLIVYIKSACKYFEKDFQDRSSKNM